jgi:AraC-like DNA-binding protein
MFHLTPPYDGTAATPFLGPSTRTVPGSVLAVRICERNIITVVGGLRARWPALPVVGWVEEPSHRAVHLAALAARLHLRTVLCGNGHHDWALRYVLASRHQLGQRIVEWLPLRGTRLAPRSAGLIAGIIDQAPAHAELSSLLRALREPGDAVRQYLRAKRLPSAREWWRLGRALHAALQIQAEPERALPHLAAELGYSDSALLRRQLRDLFAARPGEIRTALGTEWLLERWVERVIVAVGGAGQKAVNSIRLGAIWSEEERPS